VGLAAFTKEAFLITPVIAAAWLWWLGKRRWAGVAMAIGAMAALGVALSVLANGGDYYQAVRSPGKVLATAQQLAVSLIGLTVWPLALTTDRWKVAFVVGLSLLAWQAALLAGVGTTGRYLYPLVIAAAIGPVVASARRWALLAVLAALAVGNLAAARHAAVEWAAESRTFASFVDELRADPRGLVISVRQARNIERAWAIREYLPDRPMVLLSPRPLPGFMEAAGANCLEIDVDGAPVGACPQAVMAP
jgi:hypothetical protein